MNLNFLVRSVTDIILNPAKVWRTIHSEDKSVIFLIWNLFFPLILLASISALAGSLLFNNPGLKTAYSVLAGIRYLILFFLVIFGTTLIFMRIASFLSSAIDFKVSFRITAFSLIPFFLCQILSLTFESFIFVNVLAFYGLYICWTGIEELLNTQEKQKLMLMISAAVVFITLFIIINWILSHAFDKLYFAFLV
jgi:hypothetical protein